MSLEHLVVHQALVKNGTHLNDERSENFQYGPYFSTINCNICMH